MALTDKKLIEKFLNRGVEHIFPSKDELRKKMLKGERMKVYQGFDPTGPFLHVGHAMGIRAMRILQQLGHEVIFLIGDFTAKIGDPDKGKTRKLLSDEEIEKNMAGWKKQAGQLIDFSDKKNPVRFERNYKWLSKLKLEDVLELMSHITVQRMLERDLFERRIKEGNPIRLHEFCYPLMQGYDGVAMKVDMEMGGSDQIFNMLVGRELSKAYLKKEKFVRANKMMTSPDGKAMSKTRGNGINLSDAPEQMYGKAMSFPDNLILQGFELLTDVENIEEMEQRMKKGENPMKFKKLLAFEIVRIIKGEKQAQKAQKEFERVFSKKELPSEMPKFSPKKNSYLILDLLTEAKLASSKSEAKRLIEQKAVKINNQVITDWKKEIKMEKDIIIKVGKRKFIKCQKKY